MLRVSTAALVAAFLIAPPGVHDAAALATFRVMTVMPGKTRQLMSGSEYRVCNEGHARILMLTPDADTAGSSLEPGSCVQCIGTMLRFKNESREPIPLYAYGGMGGRPGRGPGHS